MQRARNFVAAIPGNVSGACAQGTYLPVATVIENFKNVVRVCPDHDCLPVEPFRYYRFGARTVSLNGCVEVEGGFYGAPPGWLGQRVQVHRYLHLHSSAPQNAIRPRTKRGTKTQGLLVHVRTASAHASDTRPALVVGLPHARITAAAAACCADHRVRRSARAGGAFCRPRIPVLYRSRDVSDPPVGPRSRPQPCSARGSLTSRLHVATPPTESELAECGPTTTGASSCDPDRMCDRNATRI